MQRQTRQRLAFTMQLKPGHEQAYRERHDAIWPELSQLLGEAGVSNYSIHLDPATGTLFAYLERPGDHGMDDLPNQPVMRRWWDFMGDIMETGADGVPKTTPLVEMFYLP